MKKLMLQMMKEGGKDINDILDMPFAFFMELVDESNKKNVKKTDSMLDAFM
ncbi:phage tail assembly chaperone GT [Staphylococcus ureilyticus]|uniref:phage tail assembly chaperone GT n=1 Tax=Staphylococcus ureilyticus TaxID=94138 RepID=UPI0018684B46